MAVVTLKVRTMTDAEKANQVKELVSHLAGVQRVDTDLAVKNIKVEYDPKATTITAMQKLLAINFHRVASFAPGQRKGTKESLLNPLEKGFSLRRRGFVP